MFCFSFERLKYPRNCSPAQVVDLRIGLKSKLFANERIGSHVGLFVTGNIGRGSSKSCISKESEDGEEYENTDRSSTTALSTG